MLNANVESYKVRSSKAYSDVTFYVRGLTVGELLSLQRSIGLDETLKSTDFYNIGYLCLVGWSGMTRWIDGELYDISFSRDEIEELLDLDAVCEIGVFAYKALSQISNEEEQKYKGYVNFIFALSDEKKGASLRSSFSCEDCARRGLIFQRPCGRKDKQSLIEKYHGKPKVDAAPKKSAVELAKKKFGSKSRAYKADKLSKKSKEEKVKTEEGPRTISLNNFIFPECPVTWIEPSRRTLADALWDCSKSGRIFMGSNVSEIPNKIWQTERIISSEAARLEALEIKKQTKG